MTGIWTRDGKSRVRCHRSPSQRTDRSMPTELVGLIESSPVEVYRCCCVVDWCTQTRFATRPRPESICHRSRTQHARLIRSQVLVAPHFIYFRNARTLDSPLQFRFVVFLPLFSETVLSSLEMRCEQSFVLSWPSFQFATKTCLQTRSHRRQDWTKLFSLQCIED